MSKEKTEKKTTISNDGLRYTKKAAGSPFLFKGGSPSSGTMSCYLCGLHRRIDELTIRKFIGKSQKICKDGCGKNAPKT